MLPLAVGANPTAATYILNSKEVYFRCENSCFDIRLMYSEEQRLSVCLLANSKRHMSATSRKGVWHMSFGKECENQAHELTGIGMGKSK